MLNGKQNALYRPLVDQAWQVFCSRNPGKNVKSVAEKEKWKQEETVEYGGFFTTKALFVKPAKYESDLRAFEAACLHFATISGDQEQISYWSSAAERRALWRLQQTMKNAMVDWRYVRGIARNMNMGDRPIEDLPAELILKLNTAVFIYMKRKSRAPDPNHNRNLDLNLSSDAACPSSARDSFNFGALRHG